MSYYERRQTYRDKANYKSGNTSKIWKKLRKDFQLER